MLILIPPRWNAASVLLEREYWCDLSGIEIWFGSVGERMLVRFCLKDNADWTLSGTECWLDFVEGEITGIYPRRIIG